jgi:5-formyltetrahydrofolate cyclo-ligase
MTKQQTRDEFMQRRLALPEADKQALTLQVLERFQEIHFPALRTVHVYRPIASKKEVDTLPFVRHLEALFPGLILVVPRISGAGSLEHITWDAETLFAPNAWDIPEPLEGVSVRPDQIDLVLVPLVAFDSSGYRVGYGKGFYDRFLATCRPDCLRVGLSLFEAVDVLEDRAEFDVPLSIGVTPTTLYEFV